jgi:hypothetical protein
MCGIVKPLVYGYAWGSSCLKVSVGLKLVLQTLDQAYIFSKQKELSQCKGTYPVHQNLDTCILLGYVFFARLISETTERVSMKSWYRRPVLKFVGRIEFWFVSVKLTPTSHEVKLELYAYRF